MRIILVAICIASYATVAWCECGCPPQSLYSFPTPDKDGLIEGDILLTPEQIEMAKNPKLFNMITSSTRRWPGGVVPYKLTDWRHKAIAWNINWALDKLSDRTGGCVKFRKATPEDKQYVNVIYGSGCYSSVGRVSSGPQNLSLGFGCNVHAIIQHEFIHALGFHHEHVRSDRDEHVMVKWKNIDSAKCHNFMIYGTPPPFPYDLKSVMQYGSFTFSCKLGKSTMRTLDDGIIGGPVGGTIYPNSLTDLDVKKIKYLYGCE